MDWESNHMPCKHMMAVLTGLFKWDDLPLGYRNHPLVTLDPGVMGFQRNIPCEHPSVPSVPSSDPPKEDTTAQSESTRHNIPRHPLPPSPNQSLATRIDRLQGLLTMELSPNVVDAVKVKLTEVETLIYENCPRRNGMPALSIKNISHMEALPFNITKKRQNKESCPQSPQPEKKAKGNLKW